jgi:NAD(P)-dependent dehydrogenase (short-subunit alcohol dehydrogenase family)
MKTVVITGINKGIGKALAKKFLDKDYLVIGTYLKEKPDLKHAYLQTYKLDLSSERSITAYSKKITNSDKK